MEKEYVGIDYSNGQSNVNHETDIHYGVIPVMEVGEAWYDIQPTYDCEGCELDPDIDGDNFCDGCMDYGFFSTETDKDCKKTIFEAEQFDGNDIFVLVSPYYTLCQFCSPCAPGAGYLMNTVIPDGVKAYCLGHEWFEGEKAPYPVFDVKTGNEIKV